MPEHEPQAIDTVAVDVRQVVGMNPRGKIVGILRSDPIHVVTEQVGEIVRTENMPPSIHVENRDPAIDHLRKLRQPRHMAIEHRIVQLAGIEPLHIQQSLELPLHCLH